MRKIAILAGIGSLAIMAGTVSPAFASDNPVAATISIPATTSVSGITDVSFPSTSPGNVATVVNAERIRVITNNPTGASASIQESDAGYGWTDVPAQTMPNVINDDQLSIVNGSGSTVTLNHSVQGTPGDAVPLETFAAGDHTNNETWNLNIPSNLVYAGGLTDHFDISVTATP